MGQKIIRGAGGLPGELKRFNKLLFVHGRSIEKYSIRNIFDEIPHIDFTEFTPNPKYEDVRRGVELFNREKCDAIVAAGGGSTIDVAKCIKLFCKMDHTVNYLTQERKDTGIPLVAIPTTAGTGSESTRHAVIYFKGEKQSVSDRSIIPDIAVLIPGVLEGLPVYQKKCTMLDALCQSIESWWSVNSDDESRGYSKKALTAIKNNWEKYIEENDGHAAAQIMEGANLSGKAINITATAAPHAMSYKLTSMYGLPHGHAVSLCMRPVWEYILGHTDECIDKRGEGYLKATLNEIAEVMDLGYFDFMMDKLKMSRPESNNKNADIAILAETVNPLRLKNNPVRLSRKVLEEMYGRILV